MEFKITRLFDLRGQEGAALALVNAETDVEGSANDEGKFGTLVFRGLRLMKRNDGGYFLSPPSRKFEGDNGPAYAPHFLLPHAWNEAISAMAVQQLEELPEEPQVEGSDEGDVPF